MKKNLLRALIILPAIVSFTCVNAQDYKEQISNYLKADKKLSIVPRAIIDLML